MLHVVRWSTWQKPFIYETQRKRVDKSAPVVMKYVALATRLDDEPRDGDAEGNWTRFRRLVGPRVAETWLVRTLQYVGEKSALDGVIRLSRDSFCLALSRDMDIVSSAEGAKVYDALIASGIAAEWVPGVSTGVSAGQPAGETPGNDAGQVPGHLPGKVPGQPAGETPGQVPRQPGAGLPGHAPAPAGAPAHVGAPDRARSEAEAEAVAVAEAERRTTPLPPASREGSDVPPVSGNGTANGNGHAAPLTPVERSIVAALLDALAGAKVPMLTSEINAYHELRGRNHGGEATDEELRKVLKKWRGYAAFADVVRQAQLGPRREARANRAARREVVDG